METRSFWKIRAAGMWKGKMRREGVRNDIRETDFLSGFSVKFALFPFPKHFPVCFLPHENGFLTSKPFQMFVCHKLFKKISKGGISLEKFPLYSLWTAGLCTRRPNIFMKSCWKLKKIWNYQCSHDCLVENWNVWLKIFYFIQIFKFFVESRNDTHEAVTSPRSPTDLYTKKGCPVLKTFSNRLSLIHNFVDPRSKGTPKQPKVF